MLDEGIIRRSSSQWSSPLHMVQKKDVSWRPCGDYRQLNLQTVEDKYPLPNMADLAVVSMAVVSSVSWISAKATCRSQWRQRTLPKQPSSRRSGFLSSLACRSAFAMRV
jgi:hypothetical protein